LAEIIFSLSLPRGSKRDGFFFSPPSFLLNHRNEGTSSPPPSFCSVKQKHRAFLPKFLNVHLAMGQDAEGLSFSPPPPFPRRRRIAGNFFFWFRARTRLLPLRRECTSSPFLDPFFSLFFFSSNFFFPHLSVLKKELEGPLFLFSHTPFSSRRADLFFFPPSLGKEESALPLLPPFNDFYTLFPRARGNVSGLFFLFVRKHRLLLFSPGFFSCADSSGKLKYDAISPFFSLFFSYLAKGTRTLALSFPSTWLCFKGRLGASPLPPLLPGW